ncbi:MAG: PilN domain-containing protein [Halofilum sp. (in: g-proteobacteria)]
MQRINLYQEHLKRHQDPLNARRLALLLLLFAALLSAISGYQAWRANAAEARAAAAETERDAAAARVAALQSDLEAQPGDDGRGQRLREELAAKRALLAYLEDGPFGEGGGFSGYLNGLSRQIVEGVWLNHIELSGGGAQLRLDGHALDPGHVPALIGALGQAPAFEGRSFRRLAIERSEEADWRLNFTLASGPAEDGS